MKRSKKSSVGFVLTLAATSLVIATGVAWPAQAGGLAPGHGTGHKPLHHLFTYDRHEYPRRPHRRPGRRFLPAKAMHGYRMTASPCHGVTKTAYDGHGHKVLMGGKGCYDRYGTFYVIPGSRHVIGRY